MGVYRDGRFLTQQHNERRNELKLQKILMPTVVAVAVLALVAGLVLAGHHEGGGMAGKSCPTMKKGCDKGGMWQKQCGMGQKQCSHGGGCSKGESSGCPIAAKLCKKACWMMAHKEDLAMTDDQISKVQAIEADVQKSTIRNMAEMKIFSIELKSQMSQHPINVEAIESMIDSGMAGMATSAKAAVKAYTELQTILTDEQIAKAKELKKTDCSSHAHSA
jgi:hypothetical protein